MPTIGQTVVCAETGKPFVIAQQGSTFNYATDPNGRVISDEGVDIRQKRELLDRSRPFSCYVSSDGKRVTGWKGNTLGHIIKSSQTRSGFGGDMLAVSVCDIHGNYWHGRNAGRSMVITLRPSKNAPR